MPSKDNLIYLNLEQASRAVVTCFLADVPVAVWGDPGAGKSAIMHQIADRIGYKIYDVRSSILEPSDFGIPYPDGNTVKWLMTEMLPYEELVGDEKCILLFDEFDRTSQEVLNAELQVIHDRQLNGHKLSKYCRIAACGNGASDIGTTPLSRAAMNRMCHIYVDTASKGANTAWEEWAKTGGVSAEMISYCNFRPQAKSEAQYEDYAHRTRRSIVAADKIYQAAKELDFKLDDIMQALIGGCIGKSESIEFLKHCDTIDKAPSIGEILKDPQGVKVPKEPSVLNALSELILRDVQFVSSTAEHDERAERFISYAMRWPEEPQTNFIKRLVAASPMLKTSSSGYAAWEHKRNKPVERKVGLDDSYFPEEAGGCSCSTTPRPPCSWCENGGEDAFPEKVVDGILDKMTKWEKAKKAGSYEAIGTLADPDGSKFYKATS